MRRDGGEVLERLDGLLSALRVARAQRRGEDLLQQRRLAVGGGAERAQVAPADAVAGQLGDGAQNGWNMDDTVALARELKAGFVLARKPGKLPHDTVRAEYVLEYGTDALELHSDAVASGSRVLVHDDLLATGGTARALCQLVEQLGGTVAGCQFLIELTFLRGREALGGYDVYSLITYDEPE